MTHPACAHPGYRLLHGMRRRDPPNGRMIVPARKPPQERLTVRRDQSASRLLERRMRLAAPYMLDALRLVERRLARSEKDEDLLRIVKQTINLVEDDGQQEFD